jgi:hypothetical protein
MTEDTTVLNVEETILNVCSRQETELFSCEKWTCWKMDMDMEIKS